MRGGEGLCSEVVEAVVEEAEAPAAAVVPDRVEWAARRRPVPAAIACAPAVGIV